ncbi:hypothetical protein BKA69DRAFT_1127452 [Paraphysoderma sedebokerense]|nr:hypothetical protein BKA69DRAFT_1127452 [Paraphysoderma sedebokerense]
MPKTSERQKVLNELEDAFRVKLHEILDASSEEEFWWPSSSSTSFPSSPTLSPTRADILSIDWIDWISSSSDWPWFEESSSDDELYELLEAYDYVSSNRYLTARSSGSSSVQKSFDWQRNILPYNDDCEFRQNLRTTKDGFQRLYELIKTDPVFRNGSVNQQLPVEIQLGVTLFRMGSDGDDASVPKIARSWVYRKAQS